MSNSVKDLIVLAADKNMESAIRGILSRPKNLGIKTIEADIYRHPQKDPGCRTDGVSFLNSFSGQYHYALLIFDFEGCGDESTPVSVQEINLREGLSHAWGNRSEVIIIEPELDIWVWSDSPHVEQSIGWKDRPKSMRSWLQDQGFLVEGVLKPERPKEALEVVLRSLRKPRSSALYEELAKKVSLQRCNDGSFMKFKNTLHNWFMEDLPDD